MTTPEPEKPMIYHMTEKGWALAGSIWSRFVDNREDIDLIAADYGMTRDEVGVLMAMAFQGGITTLGS